MNIYKINKGHQYKNISASDEAVINRFAKDKGQSLADSWSIPEFMLLENVSPVASEKKADAKKDGTFDAVCYGNILVVKKAFENVFTDLPVELLPVTIKEMTDAFVYVNVLKVIEAINFEGLDYQQSMDMVKSDQIRFIQERINGDLVFRDKKLNTGYYCTATFVERVKNAGMKGLVFKLAGEAG